MAEFDRSIPPGGEGEIAIRLDPAGCYEDTIKTALVLCNDPQKSTFQLIVHGRSRDESDPSH